MWRRSHKSIPDILSPCAAFYDGLAGGYTLIWVKRLKRLESRTDGLGRKIHMTTNEILELIRAGYTKADIENMTAAENADNGNKAADSPSTPQNDDNGTETQETPQNGTESPTAALNGLTELTEVVKGLTETVKALQAENAKSASAETPKTENADSAIRSFFEDIPKK